MSERYYNYKRHQVKQRINNQYLELQRLKSERDCFKKEYWQLKKDNERIRLLANHRGKMVGFATALIEDKGSEEMLQMWNDFKEDMFQKYEKER